MIQDLEKFKKDISWEEKAQVNPLFAIMSDEVFKNSTGLPTQEELEILYNQGENFWKKWFAPLFWNVKTTSDLVLLEYGCGMGRIINYPALQFRKCYGIDISETQIEYAKKYCPNRANISFLLLEKPKYSIPLESFSVDVVYSYAVLQHIQTRSSLIMAVSEMARVLKKSGKIKIQIRTTADLLSQGKRTSYQSIVLENFTIAFYFRKFFFLPVPVIRIMKHSNWTGAGCFHSVGGFQRLLNSYSIVVDTIEFEIKNKMVWLEGHKI